MKAQFFYTSGHTFTASGVQKIEPFECEDTGEIYISYETESIKADVCSRSEHEVPAFDVLFVIVTPDAEDLAQAKAEGRMLTTFIIHGAANKFDIQVEAKEMSRIVAVAQDEAIVQNKILDHKASEQSKYRARQKRRHEERMDAMIEADARTAEQKVADAFNESAEEATKFIK
jgi:hypothetical protein